MGASVASVPDTPLAAFTVVDTVLAIAAAAGILIRSSGRTAPVAAHGGYEAFSGDIPRPAAGAGDGAAAERILRTLGSKKRINVCTSCLKAGKVARG